MSKNQQSPIPNEKLNACPPPQEVIERMMDRVKNNKFEPNPYYRSNWIERKEILEKVAELKKKILS